MRIDPTRPFFMTVPPYYLDGTIESGENMELFDELPAALAAAMSQARRYGDAVLVLGVMPLRAAIGRDDGSVEWANCPLHSTSDAPLAPPEPAEPRPD